MVAEVVKVLLISDGLRGMLTGLQPGAPILKLEKV